MQNNNAVWMGEWVDEWWSCNFYLNGLQLDNSAVCLEEELMIKLESIELNQFLQDKFE